MSLKSGNRHKVVFDDVLKGLDDIAPEKSAPRFLKRSSALAEQGMRQEKVLRLVDPAECVMWAGHNRAYELLTEENCRDLIDGILAQGQQEFPAVVRRLAEPRDGATYEVICGARRHFAISWLRANNYPRFRYLIEERELTDEEAFRLADIENRDREDISDYERAKDYARALAAYYGGVQSEMAARLQVSPGWLSRYLDLARLDEKVLRAFASVRDVKELHARQLKPLLADPATRDAVLAEAEALAGQKLPAATVMARLKASATKPKLRRSAERMFHVAGGGGLVMRRRGGKVLLEFDARLDEKALKEALDLYLAWRRSS